MSAVQQRCDEGFVVRLLGFLQQRFDPRIEPQFVKQAVGRGRGCGISSEQDLATLASILWAAQHLPGDPGWCAGILEDGGTDPSEKLERLKKGIRVRSG
jgi:hypothetical protein